VAGDGHADVPVDVGLEELGERAVGGDRLVRLVQAFEDPDPGAAGDPRGDRALLRAARRKAPHRRQVEDRAAITVPET